MKRIFLLAVVMLALCGCAREPIQEPQTTAPETAAAETAVETTAQVTVPETTAEATEAPDPLLLKLNEMSIEEKTGQLFLARHPANGGMEDITALHLGGYILFSQDFEGKTPDDIFTMLCDYQAVSSTGMLMAVDEEGGTVNRVSNFSAFRESPFPSPRSLYDAGGLQAVLDTEAEKCALLRSLGINVNLAPVCDIATDPAAFMYRRSLGQDAAATALFVQEMHSLMYSCGIGSVLKHFPGYGNNADTHIGIVTDHRSLQELEANDLVPFSAGIASGCPAIMVSHTIITALDPERPATLSPAVHTYLRENMGFEGVIITDDLAMQAITDACGAEEAAVLAVLAGNDLLCSSEYRIQYPAVLEAVNSGRIPMELLNSAVLRILKWKQSLGLIW